jgi:polar amino acid transport system substrate-binding protein
MRRRSVAAFVAGAAVALAACGGGGHDAATVVTPEAEVTTTVAATPAAPDGTCAADGLPPLASYQPTFSMPAPDEMPAGTYLRTIQDRGRLVVGVSADTLLFGARDPITGRIEGFDIDVLRAVADAIFGPPAVGEPDNIEFKVITYAQRIPSLQEGAVDLVAHTMTINCERWQQIAFSTEYFTAGQSLLVRLHSGIERPEDFGPDDKVCVADGSTNLQEMQRSYPDVALEVVADLTDCLVLFQQSAVTAITGDNVVMAGFAAQDPYGVPTTELFTTEPYGIGANLAHPELIEFVNLVLEEMRTDGRLLDIGSDRLGDAAPTAVPPAVYGREPVR